MSTSHPPVDTRSAQASSLEQASSASSSLHPTDTIQPQQGHVLPSEFVFQLILEQFWGDGVSKREIRSVFTTAADANAACQDYLLRTWPRDQFSLYQVESSPQRPELYKVSALINGDRFHVWIERHPWAGHLDFSSKAIAKRAGKGPSAYILQRTIKDASGGKRRSTTRGIFATRLLAKQALAQDEPPSEWSSNQGYVLEPGGEYAHALSPSGKTAWLFIEVRPLYMNYTPLEQELLQEEAATATAIAAATTTVGGDGASALNPISLDHVDDAITTGSLSSSVPPSPSALLHSQHHHHPNSHLSQHHGRSSFDNPFSPMPSNPDEAGAFVYLVLQLKTIPYTPPILTVEAVAYEIEVANRLGITLLEAFTTPSSAATSTGIGAGNIMFESVFREDGCLQGSVEQRTRDEGLTVWVEKRAVILGDESLDFDLVSEHGSVQLNRAAYPQQDAADQQHQQTSSGARKRDEPEGGFEEAGRPVVARTLSQTKATRLTSGDAGTDIGEQQQNGGDRLGGKDMQRRYKVVIVSRSETGDLGPILSSAVVPLSSMTLDSSDDLNAAVIGARIEFYIRMARMDKAKLEVNDQLDKDKQEGGRVIEARARTDASELLLEVRVEDSQQQDETMRPA
ncbi:hypothetical protein EDD11_000286 [Mortierella claussenii]|nr:hypothetical protein EDD11_000286 [Mortierella claussenii]